MQFVQELGVNPVNNLLDFLTQKNFPISHSKNKIAIFDEIFNIT